MKECKIVQYTRKPGLTAIEVANQEIAVEISQGWTVLSTQWLASMNILVTYVR